MVELFCSICGKVVVRRRRQSGRRTVCGPKCRSLLNTKDWTFDHSIYNELREEKEAAMRESAWEVPEVKVSRG